MRIEDVKPGQVFKDNDQPGRIVYPYLTVQSVSAMSSKATVKRSKDLEGAVAPRDVRTKISLKRLVGRHYSLVKSPAELEPTPA